MLCVLLSFVVSAVLFQTVTCSMKKYNRTRKIVPSGDHFFFVFDHKANSQHQKGAFLLPYSIADLVVSWILNLNSCFGAKCAQELRCHHLACLITQYSTCLWEIDVGYDEDGWGAYDSSLWGAGVERCSSRTLQWPRGCRMSPALLLVVALITKTVTSGSKFSIRTFATLEIAVNFVHERLIDFKLDTFVCRRRSRARMWSSTLSETFINHVTTLTGTRMSTLWRRSLRYRRLSVSCVSFSPPLTHIVLCYCSSTMSGLVPKVYEESSLWIFGYSIVFWNCVRTACAPAFESILYFDF